MPAPIEIKMNNLSVEIHGSNGYMDSMSYTNTDPVDYVIKIDHAHDTSSFVFRFDANTTVVTSMPGFHRSRSDETAITIPTCTAP